MFRHQPCVHAVASDPGGAGEPSAGVAFAAMRTARPPQNTRERLSGLDTFTLAFLPASHYGLNTPCLRFVGRLAATLHARLGTARRTRGAVASRSRTSPVSAGGTCTRRSMTAFHGAPHLHYRRVARKSCVHPCACLKEGVRMRSRERRLVHQNPLATKPEVSADERREGRRSLQQERNVPFLTSPARMHSHSTIRRAERAFDEPAAALTVRTCGNVSHGLVSRSVLQRLLPLTTPLCAVAVEEYPTCGSRM